MTDDSKDELRQLRQKLRECREALKVALAEKTALCSVLDMGTLPKDWEPDPRVERQYGPHVWSFPLYAYLNQLVSEGKPLTPDSRNRVVDIFHSLMAPSHGSNIHEALTA